MTTVKRIIVASSDKAYGSHETLPYTEDAPLRGDTHINRIVSGTILSVLASQAPVIRSDGSFVRDYIYVKDVADGYITLAEQFEAKNLTGQCFNISTDTPYTVLELVDAILTIMQATHLKPIILAQASNEIPAQHLSSEKMRALLNWKAAYGVYKGLEETISWYRNAYNVSHKFFSKSQHKNISRIVSCHPGGQI